MRRSHPSFIGRWLMNNAGDTSVSVAGHRTTQRESLRNRCKLVSASNPILTEPLDENPPHRGHKGGAAGEENSIHLAYVDPGSSEQSIHAVFNCGQVFSNPALKLSPGNWNAQLDHRCIGSAIAEG